MFAPKLKTFVDDSHDVNCEHRSDQSAHTVDPPKPGTGLRLIIDKMQRKTAFSLDSSLNEAFYLRTIINKYELVSQIDILEKR